MNLWLPRQLFVVVIVIIIITIIIIIIIIQSSWYYLKGFRYRGLFQSRKTFKGRRWLRISQGWNFVIKFAVWFVSVRLPKNIAFIYFCNIEIFYNCFNFRLWSNILIDLTLYTPCIILQYVYEPTRCTKFLWLDFIFHYMFYTFRTRLVHHQEQLYRLYIAFDICWYHTYRHIPNRMYSL